MAQKNPHLREVDGVEQIIIDKESGEILDTRINKSFIIAGTEQEFYLMFASMLEILMSKGSGSSATTRVLAYLLRMYGNSSAPFAINKAVKDVMCRELQLSIVCIPVALRELQRSLNGFTPIIYKVDRGFYRINPQHIFKGSTTNRKHVLKSQLELVLQPNTSFDND